MGEVFLARDRLLKKQIALKVVRPALAENRSTVRRFLREVALAHSVTHPNVVRIYDTGEAHGLPYFSMEYLQGQTLDQLIDDNEGHAPPMTVREIRDLAIEILHGLEAAHAAGVIHRDLKPANVMLTHRGAIVMDFGVAGLDTLPHPVPDPSEARSLIRTEAGTIFGSPAYMAPELWEGSPATVQSDLYSFGVMMYQLLTGKLPIEAKNAREFLDKLRNTKPTPLRSLRKDTPWRLASLVQRCMSADPEERPASAEVAASTIEPLGRRQRRLALAGGIVTLAAVGALFAFGREPSYAAKGLPDALAESDLDGAIRSWDVGDHLAARRQLDRLAVRAPDSAAVTFWRATVEHDLGDETARLAYCAQLSADRLQGSATWRSLGESACADGYSLAPALQGTLTRRAGSMGDTFLPIAVEQSLVPRLESGGIRSPEVLTEAKSVLARLRRGPGFRDALVPTRWALAEVDLLIALNDFPRAQARLEALIEQSPESPAVAQRAAWLFDRRGDRPRAAKIADELEPLDPRPVVRMMLDDGRLRDAWTHIEQRSDSPYRQNMIDMWCGYAYRFELRKPPAQCEDLGPGLTRALTNWGLPQEPNRPAMSQLERTMVARQRGLDVGDCLERIEVVPNLAHVTPPFESYFTQLQISAALCPHNPANADLESARQLSDTLVTDLPGDPWARLLEAQTDAALGSAVAARKKRTRVAQRWHRADSDLPLVRRLRGSLAEESDPGE